MTNHRTRYVGHGNACQAKCSCGWRSDVTTKAEAEGLEELHLRHVNRVRAHLSRPLTLEQTLAWYVQRAVDNANTPEERAQWERLAEELRPRVEGQPANDTPLWE